jgi:hypothetical protein
MISTFDKEKNEMLKTHSRGKMAEKKVIKVGEK